MEKSHFISMGVKELLHELLTNENVQFGEIDNYNHIKKNTNSFNTKSILLMYYDLCDFLANKVRMKYEGELYSLSILSEIKLHHPNDLRKFGVKNGLKLQKIIDYGDWENNDTNENELDKYLNLASTLNRNNEDLELEYNLYEVNKYVNMFNFELETRKIDIKTLLENKEPILIDTNKNNRFEPKQPLTFPELFKMEYKGKIQQFYNRLIANGLIDKNHVWRETADKNEPAKVYYWLLNKDVFKVNKPTPALICFYNEFGITAYRDTEPTPPADVRAVSVRNLLNPVTSNDERKRFEQVFLPFLSK